MTAQLLDVTDEVRLTNAVGTFWMTAFSIRVGSRVHTHLGLRTGELCPDRPLPVRVNSACATSEVLGDGRCDCAWQMWRSLERFVELGSGLLTYHPSHEGRGIGLFRKVQSYALMDREGISTSEAFRLLGEEPDQREYSAAAVMLAHYGVRQVRLLSNNPRKIDALRDAGLDVASVENVVGAHNAAWHEYLASKARDFGHEIDLLQQLPAQLGLEGVDV